MNSTLGQLIETHSFDVLDYLDRDVEIPVLSGLQVQGDLIIIPCAFSVLNKTSRPQKVPPEGIAVIPATGSGHEHRLFASVAGTASLATGSSTDIGILTCTEPAYIAHAEHAYTGVAPGCYTLRRQREQGEEERLVAD